MNRATLVLAMVSALCLGGSLGFMGGVVFSRQHLLGHRGPGLFERGRGFPPRGEDRGVPSAGHLVSRLQRMLDLTPAQADAIRAEIERTRPEFAGVRDSLHERIARHLTAKQRERWQQMLKDRHPGDPRGPGPRTFRGDPGREGDPTR